MERCYVRMCMYNYCCPSKESKSKVKLAETVQKLL